MLQEVMVTGAH
jgi:chromosome segregation ATPase